MNDQMKERVPAPDPQMPAATDPQLRPMCATCGFSLPVRGNLKKRECRWGPPTPSMIPTMTRSVIGPPQQGFEQIVSFPLVNLDWWCSHYRRKLDA